MTKFQEMLQARNQCLHEKTVHDEVVNFLSQFVEDEVHKPDRTMMTGDLGPVPQAIIRQVMEKVQTENIESLSKKISDIESMKVEVPNGKEQKAAAAQSPPQSGPAKGNGKATGKGIKLTTKQIAGGAAGNRSKVQGHRPGPKPDVDEPTGAGEE